MKTVIAVACSLVVVSGHRRGHGGGHGGHYRGDKDMDCEGACQYEGKYPLFCSEEAAIAQSPVGIGHLMPGQDALWVANGRRAHLDGSYRGKAELCECAVVVLREDEEEDKDPLTTEANDAKAQEKASNLKTENKPVIIALFGLCFLAGAAFALFCCRSNAKKKEVAPVIIASAVNTEDAGILANPVILVKPKAKEKHDDLFMDEVSIEAEAEEQL